MALSANSTCRFHNNAEKGKTLAISCAQDCHRFTSASVVDKFLPKMRTGGTYSFKS